MALQTKRDDLGPSFFLALLQAPLPLTAPNPGPHDL